MGFRIIAIFVSILLVSSAVQAKSPYTEQIERSQADINRIIEYTLNGAGRHQTYDRLAELGDKFGARLTGSSVLEDTIDYVLDNLTREGFNDTHGENVDVPTWTRGQEWAELVSPRVQRLPIMALGGSVGTNETGQGHIEANVTVVRSFDEFHALADDKVRGHIIVFNSEWRGNYGATVEYRRLAANSSATRGAVAALVRSVTAYSISSPHTGMQAPATIPGASITLEDAVMLQRMYDRGYPLAIRIHMEAANGPMTISRNVVAEITGSEFPNETVIFGGHIDAWDVGEGAMDDGGGVMISWQALSTMNALGLRPRRTIRLVLWTAEEQGLIGGAAYYKAHKNEVNSTSLIMESDAGAFKPRGVGFSGSGLATLIMREILQTMLSNHNMTEVKENAGSSSDTGDWVRDNVPGVELFSYNEDYFHYHHTHGDAMTVLNADDLDHCTILWATVAYTVANMDDLLPRTGDGYVTDTPTTDSGITSPGTTVGGIDSGVTSRYSPWLTALSLLVIVLFNVRFFTRELSHSE